MHGTPGMIEQMVFKSGKRHEKYVGSWNRCKPGLKGHKAERSQEFINGSHDQGLAARWRRAGVCRFGGKAHVVGNGR